MVPHAVSASSNCISDLETICGTLESIIKKCFGPRSQTTLMSSSTGHVTLSSDGMIILSSLQLSHLIARSIVKSLDSFIMHNGDGSKTMILYLSSLFRALRKEADSRGLSSLTVDSETFMRAFLARSLNSFLCVDLPMIIDDMSKNAAVKMRNSLESLEKKDIIYLVIKSVLHGALPNEDCLAHLAKVTTDFLTNGVSSVSINTIKNAFDGFDNSVHLVPHCAYLSSLVSDGLLLTSRLHCKKSLLPLRDVAFICMQCPIDRSVEQEDTSIVQLNSSNILLHHRRSRVEQFLLHLNELEVSILISTSKMSDFCLELCQDANIIVIDCVYETDLLWICNMCKKSPVTSVYEQICSVNLIKMFYCDKVSISGKLYTKIVVSENCSQSNSFILCAPSQGLCQQLKLKIKRCLTAVLQLFNIRVNGYESVDSPLTIDLYSNTIAGNGYFEMLLCEHLRLYCENDCSCRPEIKMCCYLLQSMLLAVPKALNEENSTALPRQGLKSRLFPELLYRMNNADCWFKSSLSSCGLKETGDLDYPLNTDVLEVLSTKTALVYSTVCLAVKLLRVDKVIGVKGATKDQDGAEYS